MEMRVASTWDLVSSGCLDRALSTKSSHIGSVTPIRLVPLLGIRPVEASKVEGKTQASECLGCGTRFLDHSCEEESGISNVNHGFVPWGKELSSTPASPFCEGEGGLCGDSACVCACDFEALKGTSEEWVGGVEGCSKSVRVSLALSC